MRLASSTAHDETGRPRRGVRAAVAGLRRGVAVALLLALPLAMVVSTGGASAAAPTGCSQSGDAVTCSFTTVGQHAFTVPAGVSSVQVVAVGGHGGSVPGFGTPGGLGAMVSGQLAGLAAGETLYAEVGGNGADGLRGDLGNGGGGGGASDVRTQSCDAACPGTAASLGSRLIVAAGGGGGGGGCLGDVAGGAGGASGEPGAPGMNPGGCPSQSPAGGGQPGTAKAVGAGGSRGGDPAGGIGRTGSAATSATGGAGGSGIGTAQAAGGGNGGGAGGAGAASGGGGGGGLFGGGGGGSGYPKSTSGGGGGGSSLVPAGGTLATDPTGTPSVTITYTTGGVNVGRRPVRSQPRIVLLHCRAVSAGTGRQTRRCRATTIPGVVRFTRAGHWVRARLSRGTRVYARGASLALGHGRSELVLGAQRRVRSGRYTLVLRRLQGRRWRTVTTTAVVDTVDGQFVATNSLAGNAERNREEGDRGAD
jgi:hypothetical protein